MNRKLTNLLAALSLSVASVSCVYAAEPYSGVVEKVNEAEDKVTLTHGPIKKFDMEGTMTMVYRVADPSMLKGLKVGDHIRFDTDKINGKFTITKMEKVK